MAPTVAARAAGRAPARRERAQTRDLGARRRQRAGRMNAGGVNVVVGNAGDAADVAGGAVDALRVVLVRHGESTWNAAGRIQGSSDYSVLTEKGRAQAAASAEAVAGARVDALYASPLARARETADIVWGDGRERSEDGRAVATIVDELREIDLYAFQGLLKAEGKERFGARYRAWQATPADFEVDGHYPVRELWARAEGAWAALLADARARPGARVVLCVAHNAVNQALLATALGLGPERFRTLLQSNAALTVVDFDFECGSAGEGADVGVGASVGARVRVDRHNQTPSLPLGAGAGGTGARVVLVASTEGTEAAGTGEGAQCGESERAAALARALARTGVRAVLAPSAPGGIARRTAAAIADAASGVDVTEVLELNEPDCLEGAEDAQEVAWSAACAAAVTMRTAAARAEAVASQGDLGGEEEAGSVTVVAVVERPALAAAALCAVLGLPRATAGMLSVRAGAMSVVDFPDGAAAATEGEQKRVVLRATNYCAHLGGSAASIDVDRPPHDG